ncbi:ArsR family transcriptional regulator [Methanosarcina sp. MSH10X1]|nr:ArsR family transcriptional regulator [Methanosarcina sp. MSH10X1]
MEEISEKKIIEVKDAYCLPEDVLESVNTAMKEDVEEIVSLFKVLADPTRLRILKALEVQSLCVCVLVECTDQKHSALSYHLKLLKEASLVDSRRERSFQIYYLTEFGSLLLRHIENHFEKT